MFQHSASYNEELTMLAQAAVANKEDSIAEYLFPAIKVSEMVGTYTKRDLDEAFRRYDTKLSRDGSPKRIWTNATKGFFDCEPHALEVSNWKIDLKTQGGQDYREDNLRTLISATLVNNELQAMDIWRDGVPATAGAGQNWSTGGGDPIDEIDSIMEMILYGIGKRPNRMYIGLTAWRYIKNHPEVLARMSGIKTAASLDDFRGLLLFGDIDIRLASLPYQPEQLGKTGQKEGIVGAELSVFYADDAPSRSDMSAAKDFTLEPAGPEVVTEEHGINAIDQMFWSTDKQVTCPASAGRIVIS